MIAAAFVGAMICMGFVILMSSVIEQMAMLIVSGVMIGYICSAVTDFIVTFAFTILSQNSLSVPLNATLSPPKSVS